MNSKNWLSKLDINSLPQIPVDKLYNNNTLKQKILNADYIQADETPIKVLDSDKKEGEWSKSIRYKTKTTKKSSNVYGGLFVDSAIRSGAKIFR